MVAERVETDGSVTTRLDRDELAQLAQALKDEGIEAIAIAFINSYRNDVHEREAAAFLREQFEFVTASSDVLNEMREFERFSATTSTPT